MAMILVCTQGICFDETGDNPVHTPPKRLLIAALVFQKRIPKDVNSPWPLAVNTANTLIVEQRIMFLLKALSCAAI